MRSTRKRRKLFAITKIFISAVIVIIALYRQPIEFIHYQSDCSGCAPFTPPEVPPISNPAKDSVKKVENIIPSITKYGSNLSIDFSGTTGIWLYFTPDLQYVVDSPNDEKEFYRHWDTLRKHHIPISQLAPRPDFKTKFKRIKFENIADISITSQNADITTAPGSLYSSYHLSNIITNKKINLSTKNFTFGECKVENSEINVKQGGLNFSNATLTNTKITNAAKLRLDRTQLDSCSFQSVYPILSDVQIKSSNQIEFNDSASLENIRGNGKLSLISNSFLSEDIQMSIDSFKKRYGQIDDIYEYIKPSKVFVSNVDMSLISFDPNKIQVIVDPSSNNPMVDQMYLRLIERFKDNVKERKLYDIAYHRYLKKTNKSLWFRIKEELWYQWDIYGYEKDNIFQILWRSLLFFLAINYLFFPFLMRYGYSVSNLYETYLRTRGFRRIVRIVSDLYFSLIYTLLLFWIFKIELGRLRVDKPLIFLWIVLQHITSLLLLTFAARALILQ